MDHVRDIREPGSTTPLSRTDRRARGGVVGALTVAAFLIFAQAFMVAPILPRLAAALHTGVGTVGLVVPAYLVPYGVASLVWGPVTDRVGRRPVILGCLAAMAVASAATAVVGGVAAFIALRVAAGLVASGVVPISVAFLADVLEYAERGRALGWLFGGMAGGMAVGSAAGALAEPAIGWQGLFLVVAGASAGVLAWVWSRMPRATRVRGKGRPAAAVLRGYLDLLRVSRARRTYAFVAINAILQSGVYTWLGVYLEHRYALGSTGIGIAMLGYGIPGLLLGPLIGRAADRHGRALLIPAGMLVTAVSTALFLAPVPLAAVNVVIAALSLGYDLTQPLLAGIVTDLPGPAGQAVALMAVVLFCGFGAGSLVFQAVLAAGFAAAFAVFAGIAIVAAVIALRLMRAERPARA